MIWLNGVFQCEELGVKGCGVSWDAVAAAGAWAAAIATFLAVLLPYWAGVKKDRVRRRLAIFEFESTLEDLTYRADHGLALLDHRRRASEWLVGSDWQALRFPPPVHAIEPSQEAERLLVLLARLRVDVSSWNSLVENYEQMGGEFQGSAKHQIIEGLMQRLKVVAITIEKATNAIRLMT